MKSLNNDKRKFHGIYHRVNEKNALSTIIDAHNIDDVFCLMTYVVNIENSRVLMQEKCKDFFCISMVKDEVFRKIDNFTFTPYSTGERDFRNIYNAKEFEILNRDEFYYHKNVTYDKKPNEFIVLQLCKMFAEDVIDSRTYISLLHPNAYHDEKLRLKLITETKKYVYNATEGTMYPDITMESVLNNKRSNRMGIIDILPLDYIVLKPIVPIVLKDDMYGRKLAKLDFFFIEKIDQNDPKYTKIQYMGHTEAMMKFLTTNPYNFKKYSDISYHEMKFFIEDKENLHTFLGQSTKYQVAVLQESIYEIMASDELRNAYYNAKCYESDWNVSNKTVNLSDYIQHEYNDQFKKMGLGKDYELDFNIEHAKEHMERKKAYEKKEIVL